MTTSEDAGANFAGVDFAGVDFAESDGLEADHVELAVLGVGGVAAEDLWPEGAEMGATGEGLPKY